MKWAKMLNGYAPIFSQFGSDIYASDVVQQAVNCIVREMKKLQPQHVRRDGNNVVTVSGNVQAVLKQPNALMTTTDFIEKVIWQLFFNYNSFILPTWDGNTLTGLYPLQPTNVEFLQDASGEYFVKLRFRNMYEGTVKYSDLIHVRYNFSVNEFMGGNQYGQPDHDALLKSLELNNTMLQGVGKALKSSFAINGVVKYNTLIDGAKTEAALNELTERLNRNENGFMPLDMKGEFIPFQRQIQMVDPSTLKFIDEKILRHFGVPLAILTGDYTKAQYEAFFQKTIEPLIVSLNQAFTKALFSTRESNGFGNEIVFYHNQLDFMTMNEKVQFLQFSASVGAIRVNEIRAATGYPPFTDDEGGNTIVMSKNYGSIESVKDMDLNKTKQQEGDSDAGTENNTDDGNDSDSDIPD
ncbi:MAG: phage portal protein [Bacteroidaceae bacterium]|nr:phage portal protein [Bacteroidaceae bacterium]